MTTLDQPALTISSGAFRCRGEDRPPLKVNLFERMQGGNCQLIPLFPYEDADSLVPAGAIFRGEPGADFGQFFHFNTVDEVAHVFGANGALLQTGQIYATQPLHGVNSFLKDPTNPDNFLVLTVTQHQRASGPQAEAVIFRCGKCHEVLERYEYDAQPAPEVPTRAMAWHCWQRCRAAWMPLKPERARGQSPLPELRARQSALPVANVGAGGSTCNRRTPSMTRGARSMSRSLRRSAIRWSRDSHGPQTHAERLQSRRGGRTLR